MKTITKTKIFIFTLILVIVLMVIYCLFFSKTSSCNKDNVIVNNPNTVANVIVLPSLDNFEALNKQDFKNELEKGNTILIDVRTPEELTEHWIISENQKHIVYWSPDFETELNRLDKSKKYLIYCWHGARSNITKQIMKDNWFNYVKDLAWGISNWNK